jgi:hypothetical protein
VPASPFQRFWQFLQHVGSAHSRAHKLWDGRRQNEALAKAEPRKLASYLALVLEDHLADKQRPAKVEGKGRQKGEARTEPASATARE